MTTNNQVDINISEDVPKQNLKSSKNTEYIKFIKILGNYKSSDNDIKNFSNDLETINPYDIMKYNYMFTYAICNKFGKNGNNYKLCVKLLDTLYDYMKKHKMLYIGEYVNNEFIMKFDDGEFIFPHYIFKIFIKFVYACGETELQKSKIFHQNEKFLDLYLIALASNDLDKISTYTELLFHTNKCVNNKLKLFVAVSKHLIYTQNKYIYQFLTIKPGFDINFSSILSKLYVYCLKYQTNFSREFAQKTYTKYKINFKDTLLQCVPEYLSGLKIIPSIKIFSFIYDKIILSDKIILDNNYDYFNMMANINNLKFSLLDIYEHQSRVMISNKMKKDKDININDTNNRQNIEDSGNVENNDDNEDIKDNEDEMNDDNEDIKEDEMDDGSEDNDHPDDSIKLFKCIYEKFSEELKDTISYGKLICEVDKKSIIEAVLSRCLSYPLDEIKEFLDYIIDTYKPKNFNITYSEILNENCPETDTLLHIILKLKNTIPIKNLNWSSLTYDQIIYLFENGFSEQKLIQIKPKDYTLPFIRNLYQKYKSDQLKFLESNMSKEYSELGIIDIISEYF